MRIRQLASLSAVAATSLSILTLGCGTSGLGAVSPSANPLVALYGVAMPTNGSAKIEFGKDTTYGLSTSEQTGAQGQRLLFEVAGMQQNTAYHMRAVITEADGTTVNDSDHTFKTGTLAANVIPSFTSSITSGATPQPGVELLDVLQGKSISTAFATDVSGNVIWAYPFADYQNGASSASQPILYPVRLLSNGHMAGYIAVESNYIATSPATPVPAGSLNVLREFDLVGTTIRQLTMSDLNSRMAAAGFNVNLQLFSHDFQQLSNGHWLIMANTVKTFANLPGYPGNEDVTGDVVIDLDANWNPVWYWNEFDHLDVNRHPMNFPDWTHSNSITYSADDGNFIVSIRHQNWIVKVDYRDGAGTGKILWRLGEGGDFKLLNGVDPTDWFYAQHNAVYTSPNTTGTFNLALMDNGDDRQFPAGVTCGAAGAPACLYSTVPVLQVNENAMTAALLFHQIIPPAMYNAFAGDNNVLANNDVAYDLAGVGSNSYLYEVTQTANPLTVWQMAVTNNNVYRGTRLPSLYPGVQW